ncbi:hypothetical protein IE077_004490 [Cardiosporidium cionae]|uniref:Uncharacterized protein n=1 Tax=Cardiosporidium cionae TaxID=476202 RepID=A0ABQ7J8U7_9APIC|nr:hypothetical protein IE077_004490 [Cardiosporidium cionae]|eukprot:KAF8820421.1 hypothetical protein IE077_004490 [Cardiosporidium cionae]
MDLGSYETQYKFCILSETTQEVMPPPVDTSSTSLSFLARGIASIQEAKQYSLFSSHLKSINFHCNHITSLKGIECLHNLEELIISSNLIEKIDFLNGLRKLKYLDLSANLISDIHGLVGLYSLQKLALAYNRISSLEGLQQIWGGKFSLEKLDLRENSLHSLQTLMFLGGLHNLTEIFLQGREVDALDTLGRTPSGNLLCRSESYRLIVIQCAPKLLNLDGVSVSSKERDCIENSPLNLQTAQKRLQIAFPLLFPPPPPSKTECTYTAMPLEVVPSSHYLPKTSPFPHRLLPIKGKNGISLSPPLPKRKIAMKQRCLFDGIKIKGNSSSEDTKEELAILQGRDISTSSILPPPTVEFYESSKKEEIYKQTEISKQEEELKIITPPLQKCIEELRRCTSFFQNVCMDKQISSLPPLSSTPSFLPSKTLPSSLNSTPSLVPEKESLLSLEMDSPVFSEFFGKFSAMTERADKLLSEVSEKEKALNSSKRKFFELEQRLWNAQQRYINESQAWNLKEKELMNTNGDLRTEIKKKEANLTEAISCLSSTEKDKIKLGETLSTLQQEYSSLSKTLEISKHSQEEALDREFTINKDIKGIAEEKELLYQRLQSLEERFQTEQKIFLEKEEDYLTREKLHTETVEEMEKKHQKIYEALKTEFEHSFSSKKMEQSQKLKALEEDFRLILEEAQQKHSSLHKKMKELVQHNEDQRKTIKSTEKQERLAKSLISELQQKLAEEKQKSSKEHLHQLTSNIYQLNFKIFFNTNTHKEENESLRKLYGALKIEKEELEMRSVDKEKLQEANLQMEELQKRLQSYKQRTEDYMIKVESLTKEVMDARSTSSISIEELRNKSLTVDMKSRFIEELNTDLQKVKLKLNNKEAVLEETVNLMKRKEMDFQQHLENVSNKMKDWENKSAITMKELQKHLQVSIHEKNIIEEEFEKTKAIIHKKDSALEFAQKEVEMLKEGLEMRYNSIRKDYEERLMKEYTKWKTHDEEQEKLLKATLEAKKKVQSENNQLHTLVDKEKEKVAARDEEMRLLLRENQKAKKLLTEKVRNVNALLRGIETECHQNLP